MRPAGVMSAGMIPAFEAPGDAIPGQFGPMIRVFCPRSTLSAQNAAESCTGTPSVITTASGISASIASTTAALVNAGGTKMTDTSAPVSLIASATGAKTGSLAPSNSTVVPALRGFTPPATLVPAASIRLVCLEPSEPVMPWTITFESLVSQIAMTSLPRSRELGGALGRSVHRVHPLDQRVVRTVENGAARLGVVAVETYHERLGDRLATLGEQGEGLDDAVGDRVAGGDAAEDVHEDRLDRRVAEHDLQTVCHHRGAPAAADVEEVGRLDAAVPLARVSHHVEGGHDQAGAVADDADLAVQLDVVEVLGLGRLLQRVHRGLVDHRLVVGVPERRVLVQRDLGVERQHPAVADLGERVDLAQRGVLGHEGLPQLHRDVDDLLGDLGRVLGRGDDLAGLSLVDALAGVDRDLGDPVRLFLGDRLDLHAAGDAGDAEEGAVGAIQQVGEVVLLLDVGS